MKTRFLWFMFFLCLLVGILGAVYLRRFQPATGGGDFTTQVNRLIIELEREWPNVSEVAKNELAQDMDFSIIDESGTLLYQTREGISNSLSQATGHYDIIRSIEVDGAIVGNLLIHNPSEEAQRKEFARFANLFFGLSLLIAVMIILYATYLKKKVIDPFRNMQGFAEAVAMGNLEAPLEMDRDNIFGAFTQSFDIMREELKNARLREEAAVNSRKELVAQLSHDIKTPVASIKAMAEVMDLTTEDPQQKETIASINAKADQIDKLVSNLFHATLEELEHLEVNCEELSSTEIGRMISEADHKKLVTSMEIPEAVVMADPLRLSQVIGNLISNSYKYAGTPIAVKGYFEKEYLTVEVKDQGSGVPEEELELILEKFKRGSNSAGKDGAGLGLYISAYLMRRMNGELNCHNDGGFVAVLHIKMA
ncbi:MAG: HAMP domain-containing histidine kinase [Lachnospiraceae bacterium]|nr:HAMP domain-containing histidine kinase [Lachnospiraceae bacterium]